MTPQIPGYLLAFESAIRPLVAAIALGLIWVGATRMQAPAQSRGRVIGLYILSALGMRAFSGISIGIAGSLIGIHWSLALSAMALLAAISVLMAFSGR